ncbi:MAG: hypothetical protein ABI321_09305 [Polyangia bacterium]
MRAAVAVVCFFGGTAIAAPDKHDDQRYDGPRISMSVPRGARVTEVSDVAAEAALEVVPPASGSLAGMRFHVLLSNAHTTDGDVEAQGTVWRDKRIRNRASWGVPATGVRRVEQTRIGALRAVRFVDEVQSALGGRQIMLCAALSAHLTCVVGSAPADSTALEPALEHILGTAKRP